MPAPAPGFSEQGEELEVAVGELRKDGFAVVGVVGAVEVVEVVVGAVVVGVVVGVAVVVGVVVGVAEVVGVVVGVAEVVGVVAGAVVGDTKGQGNWNTNGGSTRASSCGTNGYARA